LASFAYFLDTLALSGEAGITVVLMPGHSEVMSDTRILSVNGLTVLGEGSGALVPELIPYGSASDTYMLTISANSVKFSNIRFKSASSYSPSRAHRMLNFSSTSLLLEDCIFEIGDADTAFAVIVATLVTTLTTLIGCSFVKTASYATSAVSGGLSSYGPRSYVEMIDCTFDGGASGWDPLARSSTSVAGLFTYGGSSANSIRALNTTFINGASFLVNTATLTAITMAPGSSEGVVIS
jgi:hypothetical protein